MLNNWDMIYGMRSCIAADFRSAFVEWVNIVHFRQDKKNWYFCLPGRAFPPGCTVGWPVLLGLHISSGVRRRPGLGKAGLGLGLGLGSG